MRVLKQHHDRLMCGKTFDLCDEGRKRALFPLLRTEVERLAATIRRYGEQLRDQRKSLP